MDIRKLQRVVVDGLEDLKAQHIVVFNTEHLSALFERVIIASGTSNRQTKALASSVRDAVKQAGFPVPRTEGEANGEWIIVDCGAAVVHVMQPTIRTYYHLEEIWGDKPVNIKLASSTVKLVKAAEPEAPVKKPATKKAVAKKATAGKPPARAPVKKVVAAKTSPARRAPAKKVAAPAGRVVTRVVGVKKPAAKKAAAKTTAAKKAPARKTPSRG
jgi:ribosome-associated protein